MSVPRVSNRLASALERSDELPNVRLAIEIAANRDSTGVRELIACLESKERAIRHDAIKVLYEVGGRRPELIAPHVDTFIDQLSRKDNRIVWGAMTALGAIATLQAAAIWKRLEELERAHEAGSVITQDWGVRVLAAVASTRAIYERKIFPYLLKFLEECISRDVPKHAESIVVAVTDRNKPAFLRVLRSREKQLKPSQAARVRKLHRRLNLATER